MTKEVVTKDNSFGIISVVLGIISLAFSLSVPLGSFGGILLGITGLIFGIFQDKKGRSKWSKTGIILSILGILLGIVIFVWLVSALSAVFSQIPGGLNAQY